MRRWILLVSALSALLALPLAAQEAPEKFSGDPYVMHFRQVELSAALHLVAAQTGFNLVMAANHRPRFSGDFSERWDSVLSHILHENHLGYHIVESFVLIAPPGDRVLDPRMALIPAKQGDQLISLNVVNASLSDVATVLVKEVLKSRMDSKGPELRGSVTVQALEVSPHKLLQLVLATNGYGFVEHDGVVTITMMAGFETPSLPETVPAASCLSFACDDVSPMILRGTMTSKKTEKTSALFEFPEDRFKEVTAGALLGKRARAVDVTATKVTIVDGLHDSTEVTFRIASPP